MTRTRPGPLGTQAHRPFAGLRVLVLPLACLIVGCGSDVYFCSDPDGDPPGCEICSNGSDDDLDGKTDCADSECRDAAACEGSRAVRPRDRSRL